MTNIDKTMTQNDEEVITQENDIEEDEVEVEEETVEQEEVVEEESIEDLKKKLATAEAQKEHWRDKANKTTDKPAKASGMSLADSVAILKADVHEDDIERVEKFAKDEKISIRDAVKHPELKAILSLRNETRNTAVATNTGNARRGSTKVTGDVLIANANQGKLPESDEEINRLIAEKLKRK